VSVGGVSDAGAVSSGGDVGVAVAAASALIPKRVAPARRAAGSAGSTAITVLPSAEAPRVASPPADPELKAARFPTDRKRPMALFTRPPVVAAAPVETYSPGLIGPPLGPPRFDRVDPSAVTVVSGTGGGAASPEPPEAAVEPATAWLVGW
jgi:hypothetical protein